MLLQWLRRGFGIGVAGALIAACSSEAPPRERVGAVQSNVWTNGSFESGAVNTAPQSWTLATFLNSNGVTITTPQTRAGLNLAAGGDAITLEIAGNNSQDPDLGATASFRYPRYGARNARINFHSNTANGHGQNVNSLSQTMTVAAGDVDPADGKVHVRFTFAPVLQNPLTNHTPSQVPYYFIQVTNVTQGTVLYTDFNHSAAAGVPWKSVNTGTANEIEYLDWTLVDVASGIATGDQVKLEAIAAGCSLGAHFGELYLDGVGSVIPGLNISGSAPAQVNAGANLTYTLRYTNGTATVGETGVVLHFTTPPNTVFESFTPPAGATCTTPGIGGTGVITCTFAGTVAAGTSATFNVTVQVVPGTTGQIVAADYDISSNQESTLVGNKIETNIGCAKDGDCTAGNWCNIGANACVPTLANGQAIPNDPAHTTPTLNGKCTAAAGTLVCTSAVCDAADDECGFANGDGTCTAGTAVKVCRTGVCDPDGKCGLANGNGTCTLNAQCRSGSCSVSGTCKAAAACNGDADCTAPSWCEESTHTCKPQLANGLAIPTDAPHTAPTLNGTCSAGAGTLVCVAGVCDTADNKCGFANGDGSCNAGNATKVCRAGVCDPDLKCGFSNGIGPCTVANQTTVCRSGVCSAGGTCLGSGACNVDADCTGGKWCLESTHTCTAKLANGTPLPTDASHGTPVLNGKCNGAAATLVCESGVCDGADDKCGIATGDGPCDATSGATVCRSGDCGPSNTCIAGGGCNTDADCTGGDWCNELAHTCTAKLANGEAIPSDPPHTNPVLNGKCNGAASFLVCKSGVCDSRDDKCGYADKDGPCTAETGPTVCRSGRCSALGACEAADACNSDAECTSDTWCNETSHTCNAKLPNGAPLAKDPAHTNPTLDGNCTAEAATLVCASAVCDPKDNACGFLAGDGACTPANGNVVCRSKACGPTGACAACNVDSECGPGQACIANECIVPETFPPPSDPGTLEGGGISCSAAPLSRGTGAGALFGVLAAVAALALRRRQQEAR